LITPRPNSNIVNAILNNTKIENINKIPILQNNNTQRDYRNRKYTNYKDLNNLNTSKLVNEKLPDVMNKNN